MHSRPGVHLQLRPRWPAAPALLTNWRPGPWRRSQHDLGVQWIHGKWEGNGKHSWGFFEATSLFGRDWWNLWGNVWETSLRHWKIWCSRFKRMWNIWDSYGKPYRNMGLESAAGLLQYYQETLNCTRAASWCGFHVPSHSWFILSQIGVQNHPLFRKIWAEVAGCPSWYHRENPS